MAAPPITQEDLLAFVDGETDPLANTLIAAHLATSPQDAALVDSWQRQNELIRAAFGKVEHEPVPLSLSLKPARTLRANNLIRLVASASQLGEEGATASSGANAIKMARLVSAVFFAFSAGMAAAFLTPRIAELARTAEAKRNSPLQVQAMASLQALGGSEGVNETEAKPVWVALSPHDLTALGLSITGFAAATKISDRGACLFFSKATQPLTLCMEATEASDDMSLRTAEAPSSYAVEWIKDHKHIALAGHLPKPELVELALRIDKCLGAAKTTD